MGMNHGSLQILFLSSYTRNLHQEKSRRPLRPEMCPDGTATQALLCYLLIFWSPRRSIFWDFPSFTSRLAACAAGGKKLSQRARRSLYLDRYMWICVPSFTTCPMRREGTEKSPH